MNYIFSESTQNAPTTYWDIIKIESVLITTTKNLCYFEYKQNTPIIYYWLKIKQHFNTDS